MATVIVASKRVPKSDQDVDPQEWVKNRDREEAAADKLELPSMSDVKDAAVNAAKFMGKYAKPSDNPDEQPMMKRGGKVKKACKGGKMASGGKVGSASKRADGIAIRGKTRGKLA